MTELLLLLLLQLLLLLLLGDDNDGIEDENLDSKRLEDPDHDPDPLSVSVKTWLEAGEQPSILRSFHDHWLKISTPDSATARAGQALDQIALAPAWLQPTLAMYAEAIEREELYLGGRISRPPFPTFVRSQNDDGSARCQLHGFLWQYDLRPQDLELLVQHPLSTFIWRPLDTWSEPFESGALAAMLLLPSLRVCDIRCYSQNLLYSNLLLSQASPSIEQLTLHGLRFTVDFLPSLVNLTSLDVSGTKFGNEHLKLLTQSPVAATLREFYAADTPLSLPLSALFGKLTNLRKLSLAEVASLKSHFGSNEAVLQDLEALARHCPKLEWLDLTGLHVDLDVLTWLGRYCPHLQYLGLVNTTFDAPDVLARFPTTRPNDGANRTPPSDDPFGSTDLPDERPTEADLAPLRPIMAIANGELEHIARGLMELSPLLESAIGSVCSALFSTLTRNPQPMPVELFERCITLIRWRRHIATSQPEPTAAPVITGLTAVMFALLDRQVCSDIPVLLRHKAVTELCLCLQQLVCATSVVRNMCLVLERFDPFSDLAPISVPLFGALMRYLGHDQLMQLDARTLRAIVSLLAHYLGILHPPLKAAMLDYTPDFGSRLRHLLELLWSTGVDQAENHDINFILEAIFSLLWNITDECPINSRRVLSTDLFDYAFRIKLPTIIQAKQYNILRAMMGLLANMSEDEYRQRPSPAAGQHDPHAYSSSDLELTYNVVGILCNIMSVCDHKGLRLTPNIKSRYDSIPFHVIAAVESWPKANLDRCWINYRTLRPLQEHLRCRRHHIQEPILIWATWAIWQLCRTLPDTFIPMTVHEGVFFDLRAVASLPTVPATVTNYSRLALDLYVDTCRAKAPRLGLQDLIRFWDDQPLLT
ncbi:uncharacterized protein MONBRDRAFT_30407 [Monosiga brevicollis MX1]|uniref:Protein zer-1 homolog-like C-terminal domain-containing protein n=1 Tax=Monosiga brevicollis TaxID=81824 RepID=A9VDV8_MONBE|nr:uncharacterized protein MONBRDRAFT_30407 [Monosiga brevicollis MX1]EDQ84270.1 predicted protein [Monosiga brevicollis MX1]|eukprot:XP_001750900.1 hypothetical protein [Monosiga brevicollis MX1]